jgi:hypothetical protein
MGRAQRNPSFSDGARGGFRCALPILHPSCKNGAGRHHLRDTRPRSRGPIHPSFASFFTLFKCGGRREDRVAACTRGPRAKDCAKSALTTGTGGNSRPSLRDGLRLIRAPRRTIPFATVARVMRETHHHELGRQTLGRQDHTISPSAKDATRQSAPRVHRNSAPRFVTTRNAPHAGAERTWDCTISENKKERYFSRRDWTNRITALANAPSDLPVGHACRVGKATYPPELEERRRRRAHRNCVRKDGGRGARAPLRTLRIGLLT